MDKTVLIVDTGGTGNESEALRQTLEYFGYHVFLRRIGRPRDFIGVLHGGFPVTPDYIVFSCHGENGAFVMPVLGGEVYDEDEPRGNFGAQEIARYLTLKNARIISLSCTTGRAETARAFAVNGNIYAAPEGYIDGNAALYYVVTLFYQMARNDLDFTEAHRLALATDADTRMFALTAAESLNP